MVRLPGRKRSLIATAWSSSPPGLLRRSSTSPRSSLPPLSAAQPVQLLAQVQVRAVLEVLHLHVADAAVERALHGDDADVVADDGELARRAEALAHDGEQHPLARRAAHLLERPGQILALRALVVDAEDLIPRAQAGARRGRVVDGAPPRRCGRPLRAISMPSPPNSPEVSIFISLKTSGGMKRVCGSSVSSMPLMAPCMSCGCPPAPRSCSARRRAPARTPPGSCRCRLVSPRARWARRAASPPRAPHATSGAGGSRGASFPRVTP